MQAYRKYSSYWLLPLKFSDMINSRASKVGNPIRYFLGSLLWKAGSIVCKFIKSKLVTFISTTVFNIKSRVSKCITTVIRNQLISKRAQVKMANIIGTCGKFVVPMTSVPGVSNCKSRLCKNWDLTLFDASPWLPEFLLLNKASTTDNCQIC